ncbi:MAG: hypothetical protein QXL67_01200 [Candidatus Bathyarchaeia archaeon]
MLRNGEISSSVDIFQLLTETAKMERKKGREVLLKPLGIREYFIDGSITINNTICQGVECRLCIEACPTKALYWRTGEVGVTEDLCVYCGACVLSCIVDDCIKIRRTRPNGEVEAFSRPSEFIALQHSICTAKRLERVKSIFPKPESYIKKR